MKLAVHRFKSSRGRALAAGTIVTSARIATLSVGRWCVIVGRTPYDREATLRIAELVEPLAPGYIAPVRVELTPGVRFE